MIDIPIRYYRDYAGAYDYGFETLGLPLDECALLVVDVGTSPDDRGVIARLHAARASGMRVAYVHNDLRLVANGNIVGEVWGRTKDFGDARPWRNNAAFEPEYLDCVKPGTTVTTSGSGAAFTTLLGGICAAAVYARSLPWATADAPACTTPAPKRSDATTALSCCATVPTHREIEMPDTLDDSLPGGWIQRITLRNFEHLIGYTTTRDEFVAACGEAD